MGMIYPRVSLIITTCISCGVWIVSLERILQWAIDVLEKVDKFESLQMCHHDGMWCILSVGRCDGLRS